MLATITAAEWMTTLATSSTQQDVHLVYADYVEGEMENVALAQAIRGANGKDKHQQEWEAFTIIRYASENSRGVTCYYGQVFRTSAMAGTRVAKPVFYYSFPSAGRREQYIAAWQLGELRKIEHRAVQAQAKKDAAANFVNPYKVGDILYTSWGWEQTNVDFYQIVKTTPKGVVLREICGRNVTLESSMSGTCAPIADRFKGDAPEIRATFQFSAGGHVHLPARDSSGSYHAYKGQPLSWSSWA